METEKRSQYQKYGKAILANSNKYYQEHRDEINAKRRMKNREKQEEKVQALAIEYLEKLLTDLKNKKSE